MVVFTHPLTTIPVYFWLGADVQEGQRSVIFTLPVTAIPVYSDLVAEALE